MSQMTEVSEKCDLQQLEEYLEKYKECGDYIYKSYEDVKKKCADTAVVDNLTGDYKSSFRQTLKLYKEVCKETAKKIRGLEENSLKIVKELKRKYKISKCSNSKEDKPSQNMVNGQKEHDGTTEIETNSSNTDIDTATTEPISSTDMSNSNSVKFNNIIAEDNNSIIESNNSTNGPDNNTNEPDNSTVEPKSKADKSKSKPIELNNETAEPNSKSAESNSNSAEPDSSKPDELNGEADGRTTKSGELNKNTIAAETESNTAEANTCISESNSTAIEIIDNSIESSSCNLELSAIECNDENRPNSTVDLDSKGNESSSSSEKNDDKTSEKAESKGIIRLVALDKLLDPKVAAIQKLIDKSPRLPRSKPDLNTSVIVLDSDDDVSVSTTSMSKTPNIVPQKNNLTNSKLKKVKVRLKSNNLIDKMIKHKKSKVKLTGEVVKHINGSVPEEAFLKATAERKRKRDKNRDSVKELRKRRTAERDLLFSCSSDSDDDNSDGKYNQNQSDSRKSKKRKNSSDDAMVSNGSTEPFNRSNRRTSAKDDSSSSSSEVESGATLAKKTGTSTSTSKSAKDDDSRKKKGKIRGTSTIHSSDEEENTAQKNIKSEDNSDSNSSQSDQENSDKNSEKSKKDSGANNNSSDSDIAISRKKRKKSKSPSASESINKSDDDNHDSSGSAKKVKRRKRIRKTAESSGSEKDSPSKSRKNIRKVLKSKDLLDNTKRATKEEEERRKRIEERQKLYNQIYEKPENVELKELVLDFDEETKEPLLSVDKGILKQLKPHQAAGVKFMWDACFETLKDAKKKAGSGCILAHCMGLGKTLQVVALTHTLITHSSKTQIERVLIITPLSTVNNWAKEFVQWMKFSKNKDIEIYDMSRWRDKLMRVHKIKEWFEEGGVCILGYDMYRIMSNPKSTTIKKKQREVLQKCLVDPGPDMVVCDEGHLLKNEKTSLSQAVNKMKTLRRIVLTGTPLQNNLKEYYCMIQFIKPNLLGTYKEYLNRFVNPICNGQYTDSTARDIQLMKHRSHVLHKLLEGCIQRRDYAVLAPYLPPKHEFVVFITLSEMQKKLYEFYMTTQRDIITETQYGGKGALLFQDFQNLRRIWTHPMCLRVNSDSVIRKRLARDDTDSEGSLRDFVVDGETSTSSSSSSSKSSDSEDEDADKKKQPATTRRTRGNPGKESDVEEVLDEEERIDPSEWWKQLCPEEELTNINHSPKLILLMEILQSCEAIGDKILLFSQSLQSLDVIEHFLALIDRKTQGDEIEGDVGDFTGSWQPGVDYFRLDGSSSVENREAMCKTFNNTMNLRGRLFLISTRAGSLGINLVAANRVIIFDVSWNPSHDTQSIFRVYRFGQEKPCYIYRFISLGTMEQKVYERQVAKQATAKRVVDEQQIGRHYNQSDLLELYKYELEPSTPREIPALPKDRFFADLLTKCEKLIYKYHEHDSLLENEESENLTEEERKAAWAEYQAEKDRPAQQYIAYNRSAYGNPSGTVTSNKVYGIRTDILLRLLNVMVRRDHPALNESEIVRMVPVYLQRLYAQMNNNDVSMYQELLKLHTQLETPQAYLMNPYMMGVNPMGFMPHQQDPHHQYINQPSQGNSSHVYEID